MSYRWEMRLYVRRSDNTDRDTHEVLEKFHHFTDQHLEKSGGHPYDQFVSKGRDETYIGIHLTSETFFALFGAGVGTMTRGEKKAKQLLPKSVRRFVAEAEILRLEERL